MSSITRDIFKAVHEHKMLSIEYRNKQNSVTRYWIGISQIDPRQRKLTVTGLHLVQYQTTELTLYLDRILSSEVVEGTFFRTPQRLLDDIEARPELYEPLFGTIPNLRILDYLSDCSKLNEAPSAKTFTLIPRIDQDTLRRGAVALTDEQFAKIVHDLQQRTRRKRDSARPAHLQQLGVNVLSIHSRKGLYVLAYRELRLDVQKKLLAIGRNTIFCREFSVSDGQARERQSIRRFIDEPSLSLLEDYEQHAEAIKDIIAEHCTQGQLVDDAPHLFELQRFNMVNLEHEYDAIANMYQEGKATVPIRAFFGELTRRPVRRKEYPLVLLDNRSNLDQLLAIHQAMRYPLTYVQGPPGTGKTSTIVNTLVNAFFNGRTVLFASYNNHPVDGVCASLGKLSYQGQPIPFPILRLGNRGLVEKALATMRELYEGVKDQKGLTVALEQQRDQQADRSSELTRLLKQYEERVDLLEREDCLYKMLEVNRNLNFDASIRSNQLAHVETRLAEYESFVDMTNHAQSLVHSDQDELMRYLYLDSLRHIKRMGEPRNRDLLDIVMGEQALEDRVTAFNTWLSDSANLKKLLRIFPIIATTCISAHRLGAPEPIFDMTIIDEASQCDTATTLMAILRGNNLLLVGDPQQLNPVVTLDPVDNKTLMRTYQVSREYSYLDNSVYKVFLACDSVSNEILLHDHYRCDERIIDFNNRKYYNGQLRIRSGRHDQQAVQFVNVENDTTSLKNTAPAEIDAVVAYARTHPQESIGIITPFANQNAQMTQALERAQIENASCGTVHSFQGDEKDVILFSLALTDKTQPPTYRWLTENQELINVATSRAKNKLIIVSNAEQVQRLHETVPGMDDINELCRYAMTHGLTQVTPHEVNSRALGVKPYSTQTEAAFLETLNQALSVIFVSDTRHKVRREVAIAHVFGDNFSQSHLFYNGRFDFVVYEQQARGEELPVLAIELDGKEHMSDELVRRRDREKEEICRQHGFTLIRVDNSYARRYHHIKDVLLEYFGNA